MCFIDLEKAIDRIPRKVVKWAMRNRDIPEVMMRAMMSLYEGAKTRIRVDLELSERDPCCCHWFLPLWLTW